MKRILPLLVLFAIPAAAAAATWSVDFRPKGGGAAVAANVEAEAVADAEELVKVTHGVP